MIEQARFYLRYALNDLWVNKRQTFFALLCVAAGVAVIVGLRTLADIATVALQGDVQRQNRGDLQLVPTLDLLDEPADAAVAEGLLSISNSGGFGAPFVFTQAGVDRLTAWLTTSAPQGVEVTYTLTLGSGLYSAVGTTVIAPTHGTQAGQLTPLILDPSVYPFYGAIVSIDGVPLSQLLQAPTDLVLPQMVVDVLGVAVGDSVYISGARDPFTLRGIVPSEAGIANVLEDTGLLLGYYIIRHEAAEQFTSTIPGIDRVFVRLTDPSQTDPVASSLRAAFPYLQATTPADVRSATEGITENLRRFLSIAGLLAVAIGSIGIVNTMQVIVRRRILEIAVMKTIGLRAIHVILLFLTEALLLGALGSLLGVVLGWVVVFALRNNVIGQPLPFLITPEPAVIGVVVGLVMTLVFGALPTFRAAQVRPLLVLRPAQSFAVRGGCLGTLASVGLVFFTLVVIAGRILESGEQALPIVLGAFGIAGVLYALLWLFLWLVTLPTPLIRFPDVRITLLNMRVLRARAASTLLALVIAIFALSSILLLAETLIAQVNSLFSGLAEAGDAVIFTNSVSTAARVEDLLNQTPGVEGYRTERIYAFTLESVETADGAVLTRPQLEESLTAEELPPSELEALDRLLAVQPNEVASAVLDAGQGVTAVSAGDDIPLVLQNTGAMQLDILGIGDRLTYALNLGTNAPRLTFVVVGIEALGTLQDTSLGYVLQSALPTASQPIEVNFPINGDAETMQALRLALVDVPGAFLIDLRLLGDLLGRLIGQVRVFPVLVALLGVLVGGVVIANAVTLTTMERRREIAIMKAIGLQRERVLGMIVLENGIHGVVAGFTGVSIALFIATVWAGVASLPESSIPYATANLLIGLALVVTLLAALAAAWRAASEDPLNVLRYE